MIPLDKMREHLEKKAVSPKVGKTVGEIVEKGIGFAGKKIIKHPFITLGLLGAGAIATGLADKIHDLYNITSEMRKRRVMKHQIKLLEQIARKSRIQEKPVIKKQKLIKSPLS